MLWVCALVALICLGRVKGDCCQAVFPISAANEYLTDCIRVDQEGPNRAQQLQACSGSNSPFPVNAPVIPGGTCVNSGSVTPPTPPPGGVFKVVYGVCVPAALVVGDPVLRGFDNATFEFFGLPGRSYSLLTSSLPALTVNMQLVSSGPSHIRHQGGEGTFAGSMAIIFPEFEMLASVDEAGNMTFTVNNASMDINQPHAWEQGVEYQPYVPGLGQVITVSQKPFKVSLIAVKQYEDAQSGFNRGHLNMEAQLTGPVVSEVSGVLGHTLTAAFIESQEALFEVPYLAFQPQQHALASASRRLLTMPKLNRFPLTAGIFDATPVMH